jgi:NAD-dependent dihydropyrimidine dehydrogenase PreA subunit
MKLENMEKHSQLRTALYFISIIVIVIGLSIISTQMWGGKSEQLPTPAKLAINSEMTIMQFGHANALPETVLKEIFELKAPSDLEKRLAGYGTPAQITALVTKKMALAAEHASKNWVKIPAKFLLWFIFLAAVFIIAKKRKLVSGLRNGLLFGSVIIFGVVMSSDPSPMGTVKDAIHLYGAARAIFPPRIIALSIFLTIVLLANKYICGWGCQAGVLQDLIFRINRNGKLKAVIGKQIKPPFVLTNSVRLVFFCVFTLISFTWGLDIIDPIDPFKIFKPLHMGLIGGAFVGLLLFASLFIYRPWCHFFCPFGLVGWLLEKASFVKITVNYETCIACGKCVTACPSTVMGAILKADKKTIPDCFACYTCRDTCPTGSISFSTRKRTAPPAGFFDKK